MEAVDWEKVVVIVEKSVAVACSLMHHAYDDEYVSIGYRKAMYAVSKYDPDKTKKTLYEFIEYAVIRCVKLYIRLRAIRDRRYKAFTVLDSFDRNHEGDNASSYDIPEDRLSPEGSAMLAEFREHEPVIAKCIEKHGWIGNKKENKSRKNWTIAKMRRDRLRKEYENEQKESEA